MNEQLLKTSGADVLSSRKKLRKTLWGVASTSLSPFVRPRVKKRTRTLLPSTRPLLESKNHPGRYEMEHIQLHQYKLEQHYNWAASDLPTLTRRVGDAVRVKLKGNLEEDYFSVVGR